MPLLRLIIADVALQVFTVYTKYSGRNVGSVSDDSFESMAGIEQAFKDLDIKWTFCVYVLNAMMTRTCPEVRGLGTDISLSNPLHGTMFWYIARDFVCYGIRNAGFLVPDLKDSVGPDGGVSSLQALEDLATSRMAELKIVCERLHQDVPDLSEYFFLYREDEDNDEEEEVAVDFASDSELDLLTQRPSSVRASSTSAASV